MTKDVRLAGVMLDGPDPTALVDFYRELTGWEVLAREPEYGGLTMPSGQMLGFQKAEDHVAPRWPDPAAPQQFHLDFYAADVEATAKKMIGLGASKPEFQPGGERWTVLTDPAGHPFCLCRESSD